MGVCLTPVTPRLRRPARVTSRLRRPARVTSRLRRPASVTSRLRRPARVTSRPCCLVRPALVGSCLIGPTWTWPSVPSPGSTSAPPPSWILLCVSVWKPLLGGGLCHESGSHSLKLHVTHGLHFPSCTALTHSRPPLHQSHSCHHSLINSDCLTTPAPHSLTHIKAAHKHSPSAKSCFPLVTFLSVLLFILLSLCFTPDCLTLDLWTCACAPDFCLVLFTSLPCLWYSCFCLLTLPVWFCLLNIAASGSTRLWPFLTNTNMFTISGLRSGLLFYFSVKTKSSVSHRFLNIRFILPRAMRTFTLMLTRWVAYKPGSTPEALALKAPLSLSSCNQWNLTPATLYVPRLFNARCMEKCRPYTRTNVTTSNFNSPILKEIAQIRPFWSQSRALIHMLYICGNN